MTLVILALLAMISLTSLYLLRLAKMTRHDKGLYPLCETRREMYRFLSNNVATLSRKDFNYLKRQIEQLDFIIHEYKELSASTFRLRRLATLLKQVLEVKRKKLDLAQRQETENQELKELSRRFYEEFLCCFFVHTPFVAVQSVFFKVCMLAYLMEKHALKMEELRQAKLKKQNRIRIHDVHTHESNSMLKTHIKTLSEFYKDAQEPRRQFSSGELCYASASCQY